ncbi:hypothetical protein GOBAR_AA07953 [Gossypium barbadense]|uniref:Uncharacterized protein n=1 Tax=Gossypium barbadense TaxID=3634 RepID=A0A2P5YAT2_GOSBA|nr:hypothetical protein GOBAR_AA07953 [Gossypium barbadense]
MAVSHGHVLTSFASPTPVCKGARLCCFISPEHGWWARACRTPVLNSQFQPRFLDRGVLHARVVLTNSPMAMSHSRGSLSHLVLGKNFSLFRTAVSHDRVSSRGVSTV